MKRAEKLWEYQQNMIEMLFCMFYFKDTKIQDFNMYIQHAIQDVSRRTNIYI